MTDQTQNTGKEANEPVWSYRGYQLRPSEFTTAMVHLLPCRSPALKHLADAP